MITSFKCLASFNIWLTLRLLLFIISSCFFYKYISLSEMLCNFLLHVRHFV
jgi:hypothetical protein